MQCSVQHCLGLRHQLLARCIKHFALLLGCGQDSTNRRAHRQANGHNGEWILAARVE
jgi:hypothetical protein